MSSVTYFAQPGIHATRGGVPLAGTAHVYRVSRVLWPNEVEAWIRSQCIGLVLHVCCGASALGDIRVDMDAKHEPDLIADAARLPFVDGAVDTVVCDPPYNGRMRWNHDLLSELVRVARQRVIFQHWFLPANKAGRYKKAHAWKLTTCAVWQPRTYFGRVQLVSVFDREERPDLFAPEVMTA